MDQVYFNISISVYNNVCIEKEKKISKISFIQWRFISRWIILQVFTCFAIRRIIFPLMTLVLVLILSSETFKVKIRRLLYKNCS